MAVEHQVFGFSALEVPYDSVQVLVGQFARFLGIPGCDRGGLSDVWPAQAS